MCELTRASSILAMQRLFSVHTNQLQILHYSLVCCCREPCSTGKQPAAVTGAPAASASPCNACPPCPLALGTCRLPQQRLAHGCVCGGVFASAALAAGFWMMGFCTLSSFTSGHVILLNEEARQPLGFLKSPGQRNTCTLTLHGFDWLSQQLLPSRRNSPDALATQSSSGQQISMPPGPRGRCGDLFSLRPPAEATER